MQAEAIRFMREAMEKVGTPPAYADRLARNLAEADYRGHFSHGLNRLEMYVKDVQSGHCVPGAVPQVVRQTSSTALVDGGHGLGVVIGEFR